MRTLLLFLVCAVFATTFPSFASEIELSKKEVAQGSFFRVTITDAPPRWVFLVRFQKKNYRTFAYSDRAQVVFIPVGSVEEPGVAEVRFESEAELIVPHTITIVAPPPRESTMPEAFIPNEQEGKALGPFLSRTTPLAFFREDLIFKNPFIARTATVIDVVAAEAGVVRFAGKLPTLGDTVVVDHGQELFSVYTRLEDTAVKESDAIPRGFRIGTAEPMKARFAIRLHGVWLDPTNFIGGSE